LFKLPITFVHKKRYGETLHSAVGGVKGVWRNLANIFSIADSHLHRLWWGRRGDLIPAVYFGALWGRASATETVLPKEVPATLDLWPHMRIMVALLTKIVDKVNKTREEVRAVIKWELDLWYEMWEKAGSKGLDTWYDIQGRPADEARFVRGPSVDGLNGTAGVSPADNDHEGE
jgi:hypothetical protein